MRIAAVVLSAALMASAAGQQALPPGRQQPGAPPPAPLKPGPVTIVGRVVEGTTSTAVAGTQVFLSGSALGVPTAMFTNGIPGGTRVVEADGQGQFVFRDLPAGSYRLTAAASGFLGGVYGDHRPPRERRTLDASPLLELIDSDRFVNVSLNMWRLGGISGRVVDEAGEPVVGAPISILLRSSSLLIAQSLPVVSVMTDDRGVYHADVGPGAYVVALLAATTTVPTSAVDGFVQAQREGGAVFQAYMTQVGGNGGLLARGVGARFERFMVSQFGERNAWVVRPPSVAGEGLSFYPSAFHPAGSGQSSASVVRVTSGEELSGIDIQLRPMPARRVSGHITGAAGSAANLTLFLIPAEIAATSLGVLNSLETMRAMCDGNGDFTFLGVPPGAYTMTGARKLSVATPAESLEWFADSVTIGDRDVTDLAITLQPGGRISGKLVVEGTGTFPPASLRTMSIVASAIPGSVGAWISAGGLVRLDESSRFVFRSVPPGQYLLNLNGVPDGWLLKAVTAGGQDVLDRPLEATSAGGNVDDVVVTVTDRIPVLAGSVRNDDGRPASEARVIVFPADKSLWRFPDLAVHRVRMAPLGRDGRYLFRGLPPGEYLVAAVGSPETDFTDSQTLAMVSRVATPLTLGDGENKTLDLRVVLVK